MGGIYGLMDSDTGVVCYIGTDGHLWCTCDVGVKEWIKSRLSPPRLVKFDIEGPRWIPVTGQRRFELCFHKIGEHDD
jgi:hypothetical protein